jgi:hypothetical protein
MLPKKGKRWIFVPLSAHSKKKKKKNCCTWLDSLPLVHMAQRSLCPLGFVPKTCSHDSHWVSKLLQPIKLNSTGLQPRFMAQSTSPASCKDWPLPPSGAASGCRQPPFRRVSRHFSKKKKEAKVAHKMRLKLPILFFLAHSWPYIWLVGL